MLVYTSFKYIYLQRFSGMATWADNIHVSCGALLGRSKHITSPPDSIIACVIAVPIAPRPPVTDMILACFWKCEDGGKHLGRFDAPLKRALMF